MERGKRLKIQTYKHKEKMVKLGFNKWTKLCGVNWI
jgi:hypothetical protein